MKKAFKIHLDAVIVITLAFTLSLGLNFLQFLEYSDVVKQNLQLQSQALVDSLNLDSQQKRITELMAEKTND